MFGLVDGVDWFEKVVHMADDLVRVFYALGHGLVSVALAGVLGRDRGAHGTPRPSVFIHEQRPVRRRDLSAVTCTPIYLFVTLSFFDVPTHSCYCAYLK
jgi:hypothetical protein